MIFHSPEILPASFPPYLPSLPSTLSSLCRFAVNLDAKELKEGKEWKEANKEGKEVEQGRPVSVMSSLSYRKRTNLKDSIGGKGDDSSLFSTLKDNSNPQEPLSSFRKAKPKASDPQDDSYSVSSWRKSQAGEDMDDRGSVISQAYSEATSRARKGLESRWGDFDKESCVSSIPPSRVSTRRGLSPDDDAASTFSHRLSSPLGRHRSTSRLDEGRGGGESYARSPSSPCLSRRSGGRSPGSVSRVGSRMSQSCRMSEFDDMDDSRSMAFSERSSVYSPHSSTGRSLSMPPPRARSSAGTGEPLDISDVKPVSHRNYLDPDLEKAINEVLSFKPIKFKRTSLEDSEAEVEKAADDDDDDRKSVRNTDSGRGGSSLRRSASAVDCRPSSSMSSRSRSSSRKKGKSKKKKRSHSSESDSSDDGRRKRSSSKKKGKKSRKKSKKRDESSSSSSSSSDSESGSSSGASTISYKSANSVKRAPGRQASSPEGEGEGDVGLPTEGQPPNKKEEKKRKKKVDNVMMKYLYRADSD